MRKTICRPGIVLNQQSIHLVMVDRKRRSICLLAHINIKQINTDYVR